MAEQPGQDPNGDAPVPDDRLRRLDARLRAAGAGQGGGGPAGRGADRGTTQGSRVLAELVAGPAGGALIGWFVDRWLGTSPWALLALLFLGFAVAMRNIYRIAQSRPE